MIKSSYWLFQKDVIFHRRCPFNNWREYSVLPSPNIDQKDPDESKVLKWDKDNEKTFFDVYLVDKLGLKSKEDWYKVTQEDVFKLGGEGLLRTVYDGSLTKALQSVYPDHKWFPWKFPERLSPGSWTNMQIRTDLMEYLKSQLNLQTMEDWYTVTQKDIYDHGGGSLLMRYHHNSAADMITSMFPEHYWDFNKFHQTPRGASHRLRLEKQVVNNIAKQLNITKMEDWYSITSDQIRHCQGADLLYKYHNSPSKMMTSLFPEHKWLLWKFSDRLLPGSWNSMRLQKDFMDYIAKELNIVNMDQWYQVTVEHICDRGGRGLLYKYHGSPSRMITTLFPQHPWDLFNFRKTPKQTWNDIPLRKELMTNLAKQLKIDKMEDWYGVTKRKIYDVGGAALLQRYQNSPSKMVTSMFPEHTWDLLKFHKMPKGLWDDMVWQKQFLNNVQYQLKMTSMEDWYHVTAQQIRQCGGAGLLQKYKHSPSRMITCVFTHHHWDMSRFRFIGRIIK
eukprot:TRINITY_DN2154_c0_g1_i1.p1 TRINITY_DN2154_c0_g1~~TRINITY_DN2154_c0_g1_i1.p1  ORF type:complete len:503 (+),score=96.97 TRINITY_DN2154_c0_g1_i1:89-1597(+)